jgi:transcriptional regulator with XRE-family HTH domain
MSVATRTPQPAKAVLALRGLEQTRVADAVDVSARWLGLVLNGKQRPSDELASKLSRYLGVPVEDLFVDDPDAVIVRFVRRTTAASGVSEFVEDPVAVEQIAQHLHGGAA